MITTRVKPRIPQGLSVGFLLLVLAAVILPSVANGQNSKTGSWEPKFAWPNVAIHLHVLPNGKVLFWSRREWSNGQPLTGLDPQACTPRLWNPADGQFQTLAPLDFNLFCAGHAFLPDGRLLAVGGHIADGVGGNHAVVFDPATNGWTQADDMTSGRWYPTALTLPSGDVLILAGSINNNLGMNEIPQVFHNGHWTYLEEFPKVLPYYPLTHVAPDGRVFVSPWLQQAWMFDTAANKWTPFAAPSTKPGRDYGSSVMYDAGKVVLIGGGNPPQNSVEMIDLNAALPAWQPAGDMHYARRHLNATLLPDGTVLVTGGTSGPGFNNITQPVKAAELWDPATKSWTVLAAEDSPRMYHSTAVLLPDGRVLSAGSGEWVPRDDNPQNQLPNDPKDSHLDGQIFSPPYLHEHEPRPQITSAPAEVTYQQSFDVNTPTPDRIGQVNWIRLPSVTHSFNQDQRINFLRFSSDGQKLHVTAPEDANACPPGYYMLFILAKKQAGDGYAVPSVAKMVRIH